jgi:two-component system, NarL family, nitrate/nitrite response regulator NarL
MEIAVAPQGGEPGSTGVTPLRVLFVSDVQIFREAVAAILERDPSIAVVRCGDPIETTVMDLTAQVDAILVHTLLEDGPAVARRLRAAAPHLPIIAFPLRETSEEVIAWAAAGSTGYIPVTVRLDQFVGVLKGILRGEQICSGQVAASLLRRITATNAVAGDVPSSARPLTRRERQVAELVASRLDDKEIAQYLNIGLATAKSHVHNLLRKLEVRRRRDVAEALRGQRAAWPAPAWNRPEPLGASLLRQ